MDRKFSEIQESILDSVSTASSLNALEVLTESEQTITGATSTSKVGIWRLIVWIVAFAIWMHEKVVTKNAENSRPQNQPNFKAAVMGFLDGLSLVWKNGTFSYDLTGIENVEERRIIDRCAVLESDDGELVVKIATDNNGVLEPVTPPQEVRVMEYIRQIKVPGVRIRLINSQADKLKAQLTVYVDPLVIDLENGRLLNTEAEIYPVKAAINSYLTKLEFNGAFVRDKFRTEINNSEGVELVVVDLLQWKFAGFSFVDVGEWQKPEAGYFVIDDEDLTIQYQPYALVNS